MTENKYIVDGPITTDIISEYIKLANNDIEAGAQSIFLGQVRADNINSKDVSKISYKAYDEMVVNEAEKIEKIIFNKYPDVHDIIIKHSIGEVKAGELSLFILITGGHRKQAGKACAESVDLIKEMLPIWKKEFFNNEDYHWREN